MSTRETNPSITCAGCNHGYVANALFCPNCGRPKARDAIADALIGKVLGERFLVQELLGQGASGTIYRAEHVTLRRKVAIKVLHDELSRDDLAVERFRREATTVAEIDNEHIVEIHDFGRTPDGRLYLAMELLEGETLDHVIARETQLSVERAADILNQVGEALMEAHAIGYVHRDLRPRNVYLANRRGKANFVKLLDFGLAKLVETDASAASTSLGMTFGDPRYMSPEQARGDRIDRRADIYQLGCVAYEILTGAPPFVGNRVFDILTKQVTEIPVPLPTRRPGVPLWMEAAVARMLAKDPENRFATTTRMVEALRRGLDTGEVMEDEVARRRESVPPASVSRVMQRMGLTAESVQAPDSNQHRITAPDGFKSEPASTRGESNIDSVELLRKRTGTPLLGVPAFEASRDQAASAETPNQPPVAGMIDRAAPGSGSVQPSASRGDRPGSPTPGLAVTLPPVRTKSDSRERTKRPNAEPGISQVWYDEGDRESEPQPPGQPRYRRPSVTDSLYDEVPQRRRWPVIVAVLGAAVVIGGVAFALTRSSGSPATTPPPEPLASTTPAADAAPSSIITEPVDAAIAVAQPRDAAVAVVARKPSAPITPYHAPSDPGAFVPPGSEGPRPIGPGDGSAAPPPPVIRDVPRDPASGSGAGSGSAGVSGGLQDPYGGGGATPAPDGDAPVEKKAEFHAKLGEQQLSHGDTASAASSFKKALEIEPNNLIATIGMGEIALRQGLNGDAIVHLNKAARLAPRSSRVFTLLGEAYLHSGNNKEAANQFKKALQLDPDNSRARDGYNEASSRVPPPADE